MQKMKRGKVFEWVPTVIIMSVMVAIVIIFIIQYLPMVSVLRDSEVAIKDTADELEVMNKLTDELAKELTGLRAVIENVETRVGQALKIEQNTSKIGKIESDFQNLLELIFENPELALTIPHIKKDLDYLERDNQSLRNELERMVGFIKWLFGIFITIAIGIFGMNVVVLSRGKKEQP